MQAITKVFSDIVKPYIDATDNGLINNDFTNGAVNLLPLITYTNRQFGDATNGYITVNSNADGSFTLNGSRISTASVLLIPIIKDGKYLLTNNILKKGKSYKYSCCPPNSVSQHLLSQINYRDGSNNLVQFEEGGAGVTINIPIDATAGNCNIAVYHDADFTDVIIKPMITLADMPNSDYAHYVPYAMSNQELTSENQTLKNEINLTLNRLYGKKIQIFGDSISVTGRWVDDFTSKLNGIATVTNDSVSGRRMFELYAALQSYTTIDADIVVVFVGTNDFGTGADLGTYGTDYTLLYSNCIRGVYEQIKSKAHADCEIFFITPLDRTDITLNARHYNIDCYRRSMVEFCKYVGCAWINGETFPNWNPTHFPQYTSDGVHPNADYYSIMSNHIIGELVKGGDNCDVLPHTEYDMADCWNGTLADDGFIKCYLKTNEIVFRLYRDYNPATGNSFKLTDGLGSLIAGDYFYKGGRTYCPTNYTNWGNIFANTSNEIYVYDGDTPQTQSSLKRRFYGDLTFKPNWCNPTFTR